jgi:hypothetical protein
MHLIVVQHRPLTLPLANHMHLPPPGGYSEAEPSDGLEPQLEMPQCCVLRAPVTSSFRALE